MKKLYFFFYFLFLFLHYIYSSNFYNAAVVEHAPYSIPGLISREEAISVMNRNLDKYEAHIKSAIEVDSQIIVFPEDGLYGDDKCTREEILPYLEYIPNDLSSNSFIPCSDLSYNIPIYNNNMFNISQFNKQPILTRISCLAIQYNIIIVLDMGDIQPCDKSLDSNCPSDGRYQYNTQVAFDETGRLLAKYHKTHLFYEPQFNSAKPSDPTTFESSFGVKFGMMICFDMMFGHPSEDYRDMDDVFDVVYSTWWVNTPPDFSATQIQQAWSRTMNMNLLAAGNGISWLYSGSGIYSRGHVLQQHYNPTYQPNDYLLVSQVPIFTSKKQTNNFLSYKENINNRKIKLLTDNIPLYNTNNTNNTLEYTILNTSSVHCPVNTSYYTPFDINSIIPWKNKDLLYNSDETYWNLSYGKLALTNPFNATWGGRNIKYSAIVDDLTCTVEFNVASSQPYLRQYGEEYYTVLAYKGWYDGTVDYYEESFCAFYRCLTSNVYSCFDSLIYAGTIFNSFNLTGTYPQGSTLYGLTATDELRLIEESDKIKVELNQNTNNNDNMLLGSISTTTEFNTIVLNASLIGRQLDEDDDE